jgi:transmembrane sensor
VNAVKLTDAVIARRREQASWWFARLQDTELPLRVLKRWKKWEAVPENRRMFDEIVQVSGRLRSARPLISLPSTPNDGYDGSISVYAWQMLHKGRAQTRPRLRAAAIAIGLAATFAVAAVGLNWVSPAAWRSMIGGPGMSVMETGIAEHKEILLSDGSKISLGAKTAVTADITDRARTVVLSRGEALFHVAPDPARPFRVIAGGGTITAVGTAFNVRRREDDHVVVTVTEGTVEVAPINLLNEHDTREEASQRRELGAQVQKLIRGQELSYDLQGRFGTPRLADEDLSSSWRDGRLRYRGEPLRNVIPDVNRYSRKPLILGDKAAGELLYSGTVFERDIDEWIAGLQSVYPEVEVTVTDTQHVLIRTRPSMTQQQQR